MENNKKKRSSYDIDFMSAIELLYNSSTIPLLLYAGAFNTWNRMKAGESRAELK